MAIAVAQTRRSKVGTAASLSIGSGDGWATPTAGNLLVVTANSDSTVSTPSGFTLGPSVIDGNGAYIWYKVSAGTESTVTVSPTSSAAIAITLCEYSGTHAAPFDVSNTSTIASSGGTVTTAVSVTTTAANDLIISLAALHGAAVGAPSGPSWTNSFVNQLSATTGSSNAMHCHSFYGERVVTTAAAYSSQCSWVVAPPTGSN